MANTVVTNTKDIKTAVDEIELRSQKLKAEILEARDTLGFEIIGTKYYFSQDGDDFNDGLSPETPKKSLFAATNLALRPGDAVLFKRGGVFRGSLVAKKGVTYTAYGEGEKPVITNSLMNFADPGLWQDMGVNNVYKLKVPLTGDAGIAVFDNKEWSEKRIKGRPEFKEGGIENLDCDLAMWHDVPLPTNEMGYVYLRSDKGNPGERYKSIEIGTRKNIIGVEKGATDVVFDNLAIKYGGAHGIGTGNMMGLTVQYCAFEFIGGSWFRTDTLSRYGNAIEIYGACRGYVCDHNYISQVYDAGITHQLKNGEQEVLMVDIAYTNNLIEDTSYSIEYFLTDAVNGENGNGNRDNKPAEDPKNPRAARFMKNVLMENNILRRAGCGFGNQRPDKKGACHIKGWDHYNKAWNYKLKNNIFDRSGYMLVHIGADEKIWLPEMQGNTYVQNADGEFGIFSTEQKLKISDGILKILDEVVCEKDGTAVIL